MLARAALQRLVPPLPSRHRCHTRTALQIACQRRSSLLTHFQASFIAHASCMPIQPIALRELRGSCWRPQAQRRVAGGRWRVTAAASGIDSQPSTMATLEDNGETASWAGVCGGMNLGLVWSPRGSGHAIRCSGGGLDVLEVASGACLRGGCAVPFCILVGTFASHTVPLARL
jgi:hypothetical protein